MNVSLYRMNIDKDKPINQWGVVHIANVGTGEKFVQEMNELHDIIGATSIDDPKRDDVKAAVMPVLIDGLIPAFLELQKIRASKGKRMPLVNYEQMCEDLARKLWKAYKELFPQAATMIGFNVGFLLPRIKLFSLDSLNCERSIQRSSHCLKNVCAARANWQNELARFRNTWVEHRKGEKRDFTKFYRAEYAEQIFEVVRDAILVLLVVMVETHLPHGIQAFERPEKDRTEKWPNRFQMDHPLFNKLAEISLCRSSDFFCLSGSTQLLMNCCDQLPALFIYSERFFSPSDIGRVFDRFYLQFSECLE